MNLNELMLVKSLSCTLIHIRTRTCARHLLANVHTCSQSYTHTHTHARTHTHTITHTHTVTHTVTHTQAHTHTHTPNYTVDSSV